MKRNKDFKLLFIPVAIILFMAGCAGFEPIALTQNESVSTYSLEFAPKGEKKDVVENPKLTDGVFEDFKKELSGWWSFGDAVKFSKESDLLKMEVNKTTPGYPQLGFNFQAVDFSGAAVVRIRMRAEGDVVPRVRLDLRDVNEGQTNSVPVMNDIALSEEFTDYYFDFNNKWKQSWPQDGIVDPRQISGMVFFICPGDKTFKGTIYIDEIYVMANRDGSGIASSERLVDDFSGDINWWWGCDKERVLLSKDGVSALKVKFINGQWSCFGMSFEPMDVAANPVIKMRVKAVSPASKTGSVDFAPWFTDSHDKTTNKVDLNQKVVIGTDYMDYFFDYRGKLQSKEGEFDPKSVNSIIVFVNTQGSETFNGEIFVDEMSLLSSVPSYVDDQIRLSHATVIDPSWPKASETLSLTNFSDVSNWKPNTDKILLSAPNNSTLKVSSSGAGPNWDYFTKELNATSLIEKPVLKIRMKAEGNLDPYVRIILEDNFGNTTNGRPAERKVEVKGDYTDYYFDFTGRFQQRFPQMANVNPGSIRKISFYINGGLQPFEGSILIDDIQAVFVTDYLKVAR